MFENLEAHYARETDEKAVFNEKNSAVTWPDLLCVRV